MSRLTELRAEAEPLRWQAPGGHGDGQVVTARGRTGTVTLRETRDHRVWAEFQLAGALNGQPIRCFAFPRALSRLRTPLGPGQSKAVLARVSHTPEGLELHVLAWG